MTLTDELKYIDNKIKGNQAQYDLKYLYYRLKNWINLTGEDLGYKPRVLEKAKFEYSLIGEAFKNNKAKSKKDKIIKKDKRNKKLNCNSQHTFSKFKDISDFKEMLLNSMYKKLNEFFKNINGFKKLIPETN